MRADKDIGIYREVSDLFKINIVEIICVVLQVQDNGAYPLGLDDPPNAIDLCIGPFSWGLYYV